MTELAMGMPTRISNYDPGCYREVSRENNIRIVEALDFAAFFEFVDRGFGDTDSRYLWRGQRNAEWEVISSLGRSGKSKQPNDLLWNFQKAVARCSQIEYQIAKSDENAERERLRLWSLGQHHGLLTPLIDWTIYPYVALFFAFAEPDDAIERRAIFALAWGEVEHVNYTITHRLEAFRRKLSSPPYDTVFREELRRKYGSNFGDENIHMIEESQIPEKSRERLCNWETTRLKERQLRMFTPSTQENARIHSQGGRHIYTPEDVSIEQWVKDVLANDKQWTPLLTKVILPNSERTSILRSLNKMNINYLSLFPDFDGAARHCNMALTEQHRMGLREY